MATPVRTFALRLTDEEMAVIDGKAKALGLSRAGLLRRLFERSGLLKSKDDPSKPSPKRQGSRDVANMLKGTKK